MGQETPLEQVRRRRTRPGRRHGPVRGRLYVRVRNLRRRVHGHQRNSQTGATVADLENLSGGNRDLGIEQNDRTSRYDYRERDDDCDRNHEGSRSRSPATARTNRGRGSDRHAPSAERFHERPRTALNCVYAGAGSSSRERIRSNSGLSHPGIIVSRPAVNVAQAGAEPSSSAVYLSATHGGRPRRRPGENIPRRYEGTRGRLLLDRQGPNLLLARPQRRGEDDPPADPHDPTQADRGSRVRPRPRRAPGPEGHPSAHRGRPPGSPAADAPFAVRPHPLLLYDTRPVEGGGPGTDSQGHGRSGTLGASGQARLGLVRRTSATADHRDGPGRGPGGLVPR